MTKCMNTAYGITDLDHRNTAVEELTPSICLLAQYTCDVVEHVLLGVCKLEVGGGGGGGGEGGGDKGNRREEEGEREGSRRGEQAEKLWNQH